MGGGETPPFVGGKQQALFVASMYLAFVCLFDCLARSWVCCFACIVVLLYGLLYHLPAGFLAWKGLLEVMGSFG